MTAAQTVDISAVQRCALFVLAYHHNDKTGLCCPSMLTIGNKCGVSDRSARNAIRALEHVGLVTANERFCATGQAANQYSLFGEPKNKSGRNLRSGTGRNHTTGTENETGRKQRSDERVIYTTGEKTVPALRIVKGARHA
ncbi:hypothetical protein CUV01_09475 [Paracoccus tegillarcae]|uniref:Helix-turn-helix domain-containing protein n=2 Tax=Paracoccus tegillarcae TaxID=1529068 RepID=A0A2K9EJN1_9RHOB|nr:hypothetical protein CUV01_09475 [Paracoccus tegillarcae]